MQPAKIVPTLLALPLAQVVFTQAHTRAQVLTLAKVCYLSRPTCTVKGRANTCSQRSSNYNCLALIYVLQDLGLVAKPPVTASQVTAEPRVRFQAIRAGAAGPPDMPHSAGTDGVANG